MFHSWDSELILNSTFKTAFHLETESSSHRLRGNRCFTQWRQQTSLVLLCCLFSPAGCSRGTGFTSSTMMLIKQFSECLTSAPAAAETCQKDKSSRDFLTGGSFLSFLLWTAGGAADCWSAEDGTFPTKREIISERPHGRTLQVYVRWVVNSCRRSVVSNRWVVRCRGGVAGTVWNSHVRAGSSF